MGRWEASADLRMSKRGRRRSSRRRKSSASSKQSVTPYISQKQNKSNSVIYKDNTVEKGETDSLWKENVESGSEDEEKSNDQPPREKRFKQDSNINASPSNHGNIYTVTREDKDKGVKIITSVSVDDLEDSFPKIIFQQSQEPLCESQNLPLTPVTNVLEIDCNQSHVKLEIQEILQHSTSGFKTTVIFRIDKGNNKCEGSWMANNESHELGSHAMGHRGHTGHSLSLGGLNEQTVSTCDSNSAARTWSHTVCCQCCNDHRWQTPVSVMLRGPSSSPPSSPLSSPPSRPSSLANIQSQGKRKHLCRSLSSDHFWDIPPPQQFADTKFNTLDDLVHNLASCRIDTGCYGDTEQWEFHQAHNIACDEAKERPNLGPWFEPFSECENYELMLMRPSLSTNRSSFTKEFVNGQKRRSWIRNNSIATVEHRSCSLPRKRRQTFPGMSEGSALMQEDFALPFNESFYSLIVNSLPLRTERPGTVGRDAGASSEANGPAESETADRPRPFCLSSSEDISEDVFTVGRRFHRLSSTTVQLGHPASELVCRPFKDLNAVVQVDQSEVADSGFEQEVGEVECRSPEPLTVERRLRTLAIQVTPPSCSGSEEQLLHNQPTVSFHSDEEFHESQQDSLSDSPKHTKSSVMTMTVGSLEQRFLQTDSCASSAEPLAASNISEAKTDVHLPPSVEELGGSSSSTAATSQETNERPKGCEDTSAPSCPVKGSVEGDVHSKRSSMKGDKADRLLASRSSDAKEHLKPVALKDLDGGGSDGWAKRRKLFKETREWSSAGGSSITSDITEESVSEDTRSIDMTVGDSEDRGFYTETFHSAAWIYQGDDVDSGAIPPSLNTRARVVSIRERTVRISKGSGEYPWGFRIQFSKPIVVTEVDTNGAAEEAGLTVGDYVLAVNGTDVTSIPHSEAADLARQGPDVLTLTIGSDIARGPNTPRPACRGYLHKRTQSGLIKGWRKRWFVLTHDCCLYYYRHKRDEGKRRALAAVKLEGAEVGADASLGKPFVLKCRPLSANRVYYFCATSNQEMKRWIEAIERAIHPITQNHVWVDVTRHNSGLPPLAVKSPECLGLLHKMDRSKDSWIQHYCILKDGCLYLYSGIRATHAHGGIYLQGYLVREQPYGSKKSTIELKPPSDEFKTFYLCAENPNENKRWLIALKASVKKWLPLHQALQDYMNRPPEETRM